MKKEVFLNEIKRLESLKKEADELYKTAAKVFGPDICNGRLHEVYYYTFDAACEYLSRLAGDSADWVNYYFYECRETAGCAHINGKQYRVNTTRQLWTVIQAWKKHTGED